MDKKNIVLTIFIITTALNISAISDFIPDETAIKRVRCGQQVTINQKVTGAPWPACLKKKQ